MDATTRNDQDDPATKIIRERSAVRFCYEDLSAAEAVVKVVHERYGGQAAFDQIADELGSTPKSGALRNKVSAARMLGFVTVDRQGIVTPTPLGTRLLDDRTAADARAEGFLNVPLYARLYDRFRHATLPGDKGLENAIREEGVAAKQVVTARQVFQRSARQAGYFRQASNRLVKPPSGLGLASGQEHPSPDVVGGSGYAVERTDGRREEGQLGMEADPLLVSLFRNLPAKGKGYTKRERKDFVTALEAIFNVVYGPEDDDTNVKPEGTGAEQVSKAVRPTVTDTAPPEEDAPSAVSSDTELRAS
jgi:hypothetical protein